MQRAIEVEELVKTYGELHAVDGISFHVDEGEIFGMVGPNGAGKTTTIECVEGLRRPDSGRVQALGLDPWHDGRALRERIGVQLQEAALPERIKVWEALDLFSAFYRRTQDWRPLLGQLGLEEKRKTPFDQLSGGQKQRLFIALALVNKPDLIFLDELTTGLDPQARRAMWDLVREIRDQGTTVFLTTHYMEEAERLCDRVAIIDHGELVTLDSPENLIRELDADTRVVFSTSDDLQAERLEALSSVRRVERIGERFVAYGLDGVVSDVVNVLEREGITFRDLHTEEPSLEDVFLKLTGRELRA